MERVSPWVLLVLVAAASGRSARADPQVPCYFVFGDSLVDNGNNNDIASLARANYPPYGIDFPGGATGRFSNGLTTVDAISRLLGFDDYIPAYAGANNDQLLSGVNFASAAAGIRDETGQQLARPAHQLRRSAPELPGGGAAAGEHPGGRGLGGEPPEPVHLHGGHGQQRLPQQLLHADRLLHQPAVHPGAVRRRARHPVHAAAQDPVQQRGEEGGADGGGAGGLQPQRAGAAELRRRHLRGADQRRHRDLQPEGGGAGGPVQHAARGALHLHQRLRDLPGHPQVAGSQRPDGAEQGVLRGGEEQRAGDVPALPDAVRQQERVPLLGCLPPHGGGQHPRREEGIQRRLALRRPPRRPADACAALVMQTSFLKEKMRQVIRDGGSICLLQCIRQARYMHVCI